MEEEWRPIPGYKGYEASSLGRVRRWWILPGRGIGGGRGGGKRIISDRYSFQKQRLASDGYMITSLTGDDGIHRSVRVHRMVALAFIPNPNGYPVINHKNEIKTDNRVENLEWCTVKYNSNYGTALRRNAIPRMKMAAKYDVLGNYLESFESVAEAFRQTGIRHIVCACKGRRQQAGGFQWRYSKSKDNIGPLVIKKKEDHKNNKVVDCFDSSGFFIRTYKSLTQAAESIGVRPSDVSAVIKGRQRVTHGYIFKYHTEG